MRKWFAVALVVILAVALIAPATVGAKPAPKTTGGVVIRAMEGTDDTMIEYRHGWSAFCEWNGRPAKGMFGYCWVTIHPDGTEETTWSMAWPVTAATQVSENTYTFFAAGSYGWTPLDGSSQPWATGLWRVVDNGEPGADDTLEAYCGWCSTFHAVNILSGNAQAH